MEFGEFLNKSFKTVWDHRIIWFFGILFSLFNGFGSQGFNSINYTFNADQTGSFGSSIERYISRLSESQVILLVGALILLALLIALVSIFFSLVFRGSLIHLVAAVEHGQEATGRGGFSVGIRKALPLLGESLLLGLPVLVGVLVLIGFDVLLFVLAFSHGTPSIGVIIALILFSILLLLLIIAAMVVISLIGNFADRFIVINGVRVIDSIKRSYALFRKHTGQFFIAWLIMVGIGIVFGTVFAVLAFIIGILAVYLASVNIWLVLVVAIPGIILLLIPSGFFQAFSSAFWTYFFLALPGLDRDIKEQDVQDKENERELPGESGTATA
ncbi:MAG: DUF7544 domain-containing protein [Candidatus Aquicultor sp.]